MIESVRRKKSLNSLVRTKFEKECRRGKAETRSVVLWGWITIRNIPFFNHKRVEKLQHWRHRNINFFKVCRGTEPIDQNFQRPKLCLAFLVQKRVVLPVF